MLVHVYFVLLLPFVYSSDQRPSSGPTPTSPKQAEDSFDSVTDILMGMVDGDGGHGEVPEEPEHAPASTGNTEMFPRSPAADQAQETPRRRYHRRGRINIMQKPEYKKCCRIMINCIFDHCRKEKAAYSHALPADRVVCDHGETIYLFKVGQLLSLIFFLTNYNRARRKLCGPRLL